MQGVLNHRDRVDLDLWYVPDPDMGDGIECHFWCSVTGEIGTQPGIKVNQSLLESLVSN